jgi:hypothetical protein
VAAAQRKPLLHSIWANFQPEPDSNAVLGTSWQLLHGPETGWQQFGQLQLAVTPGSFVQVGRVALVEGTGEVVCCCVGRGVA